MSHGLADARRVPGATCAHVVAVLLACLVTATTFGAPRASFAPHPLPRESHDGVSASTTLAVAPSRIDVGAHTRIASSRGERALERSQRRGGGAWLAPTRLPDVRALAVARALLEEPREGIATRARFSRERQRGPPASRLDAT